jgi:predicted AAA+ superfamily ATPase
MKEKEDIEVQVKAAKNNEDTRERKIEKIDLETKMKKRRRNIKSIGAHLQIQDLEKVK